MMHVEIIKVTLCEVDQLQTIGRQTFYDTFSEYNSEENMKKYLEERFSCETLSAELNNPNSAFFFATIDDQVVGYLKLNFGPAQTELQDEQSVEIERIYVTKAYHGKQVGQLLYDKAIQIARQRNAAYLWLGVWENNLRAIKFYQKNGFIEFGRHIFTLGEEEQMDWMMKLDLRNQ